MNLFSMHGFAENKRSSRCFATFCSTVFAVGWCLSQSCWADAPDKSPDQSIVASDAAQSETSTIAGKTVDQYASELNSEDRVVRLRAARSLIPFGEASKAVLVKSLDHEDPAVRYIASVGIGDLVESGVQVEGIADRFKSMIDDDAMTSVQMAAAYALCQTGDIDAGLPILIKLMDHPERGMVCSAAELIGKLGPKASPAAQTLQRVHSNNDPLKKNGDYHKGGAAMNALRKIQP